MPSGYAKRAVKIIREDGPLDLYKRAKDLQWKKFSRRALLETQKIRLRIKYGNAAPSPYHLIYINPKNVKYYRYMQYVVMDQLPHNLDARYGTFIIDGNWDKQPIDDDYQDEYHKMKFEDYYLWKATVEYFDDGIRWENTSVFDQTDKGVSMFQPVSDLYKVIRSDGYRCQRELKDGYNHYFMPPEYDEIRINIGRDGELIFDDGRHRFCAVKKLGIKEIPVRVYVRHKKWQELRAEVSEATTKTELSQEAIDNLSHPDMGDVVGDLNK